MSICVAAAALALAGAAGCGSDEGSAESEPEGSAQAVDSVEIVEFLYEPEEATVVAGTTVTFTNQDKAPHTATADDSTFDTEKLEKGQAADITFDEPGKFTYFCRFHVFMKGTIVVE